ncbi:MAG: serine hydrolase [Bdellovibrionales bacterium]|nr:serine hydrolase [Bdellovibrionales bacterium]
MVSKSGLEEPKAVVSPPVWFKTPSLVLPRKSIYSRDLDLPTKAKALIQIYLELCKQTGADTAIVAYKGEVIAGNYDNNCFVQTAASIMSATKSVASLLFGIMKDKGWINEKDHISKYLDNWNHGLRGKVTLEHLLTCTAGFPFVKVNDKKNRVGFQENKNQFVESLSPTYEPGSFCIYNDESVQLLGSIMARCCAAHGTNLQDFARDFLFKPLGMHSNTNLEQDKNGDVFVSAHMQVLPIDFIKLGILILNNGSFAGKQVVSSDWIKQSTRHHADISYKPDVNGQAFGYLWWLDPTSGAISAQGFLDNCMHIIPSANMVLLRTHFLRHPREDCVDWYCERQGLVKKSREDLLAARKAGLEWMPDYLRTSKKILKRLAQLFPNN